MNRRGRSVGTASLLVLAAALVLSGCAGLPHADAVPTASPAAANPTETMPVTETFPPPSDARSSRSSLEDTASPPPDASLRRLPAPVPRPGRNDRSDSDPTGDSEALGEPAVYVDDAIIPLPPPVAPASVAARRATGREAPWPPTLHEPLAPLMRADPEPVAQSPSGAPQVTAAGAGSDEVVAAPPAATAPGAAATRTAAALPEPAPPAPAPPEPARPAPRLLSEQTTELEPGDGRESSPAITTSAGHERDRAEPDVHPRPEAEPDLRAGLDPDPRPSVVTGGRSQSSSRPMADDAPERAERDRTPAVFGRATPGGAEETGGGADTDGGAETGGGAERDWNERAATIASGDEIRVELPGRGWLYVGKEYGDAGVTLLGKEREGASEVFRFRIAEPGDYGLWFQQQDAVNGTLHNERLALRASDAGPTSVAVEELPLGGTLPVGEAPRGAGAAAAAERSSGASADATAGDGGRSAPAEDRVAGTVASVRALVSDGRTAEALEVVSRALRAGEPLVERLPADVMALLTETARRDGPYPVVRAFWRSVASAGGDQAPVARREYLEAAVRAEAASDMLEAVAMLDGAGETTADDLIRVGIRADGDQRDGAAVVERASEPLALLARGLAATDEPPPAVRDLPDARLFRLARRLEQPGPDRDLRQASVLYSIIVDERPLSGYWERSRARIEYLRRHYFEVR